MHPVTFILGFRKYFTFIRLKNGKSVMQVPEMTTPFSFFVFETFCRIRTAEV